MQLVLIVLEEVQVLTGSDFIEEVSELYRYGWCRLIDCVRRRWRERMLMDG